MKKWIQRTEEILKTSESIIKEEEKGKYLFEESLKIPLFKSTAGFIISILSNINVIEKEKIFYVQKIFVESYLLLLDYENSQKKLEEMKETINDDEIKKIYYYLLKSRVLTHLRKETEGKEFLERAERMLTSLSEEKIEEIINYKNRTKAEWHLQFKRFAQAKVLLNECLRFYENMEGEAEGETFNCLLMLAIVYQMTDYLKEAIFSLERALKIASENEVFLEEIETLIPLGNLLKFSGNKEKAIEIFQRGLEISRLFEIHESELIFTSLLVDSFEEKGLFSEAIKLCYDGIEKAGRTRSIDFYVSFIVKLSHLYMMVKSPFDSFNVLYIAISTLKKGMGYTMQIKILEDAIEALRMDIGEEDFQDIWEKVRKGHIKN